MHKRNLYNPGGAHLNESIFRRYEPWLIKLAACHPEPLEIIPDELKLTTFVQGIRVAANAFLVHRYASPLNPDTFSSIWKDSVVRVASGTVQIGPKRSLINPIPAEQHNGAPVYLLTLSNPTLEQLNATIAIYEQGLTPLPTRIEGPLPEGYEPNPLVIIQPQSDGSYLML